MANDVGFIARYVVLSNVKRSPLVLLLFMFLVSVAVATDTSFSDIADAVVADSSATAAAESDFAVVAGNGGADIAVSQGEMMSFDITYDHRQLYLCLC